MSDPSAVRLGRLSGRTVKAGPLDWVISKSCLMLAALTPRHDSLFKKRAKALSIASRHSLASCPCQSPGIAGSPNMTCTLSISP